MKYEDFLVDLPPKITLDHNWRILEIIRWEFFPSSAKSEFSTEDIVEYLTKKLSCRRKPLLSQGM